LLAIFNAPPPGPSGAQRELYAVASIVVWAVVIVGTLVGLFPRAPIPRAAIWAGGLLAAFTGFIALSVTWASDAGNAFDQVGLATFYLGVFVLVALAARDGEGRWWLRGVAIGAAAIAAVALAPRFLPDLFGAPDAQLQAGGRIGYPIRYWNGLGAIMAGGLALLTWLSVHGRDRRERVAAFALMVLPILVLYMAKSRGGALATLAALAVMIAAGPARHQIVANLALVGGLSVPLVAFARSQTAFLELPGTSAAADQGPDVLVFAVATIVVAAVLRSRLDLRLRHFDLPRFSRKTKIRAAIGAGVLALLLLAAFNPVQRFDDFRQPPTAEQLASDEAASLAVRSGGGRWQYWGTALDAFADDPLKGAGAGEFAVYWNQNGPFGFLVRNAHSLFLESLAELGLIGFLLIGGFLLIAAVAGVVRVKYVRDGAASVALALFAAGIVSAAFDFAWEIPAVFAPVIVAAALLTTNALTPALINAPPPPPAPPRRSLRGLALAAATLALGWASLVACGLITLTERKLDASFDANAAGDYRAGIAEAKGAVDLMPWSAETHRQLGLSYQSAGDLVSARRELLEAVERAPEDWTYWRYLTLVDGIAGNVDAACREFERTRKLNPRLALIYEYAKQIDCPGPVPKPPPGTGGDAASDAGGDAAP
jgi:tetratricopeptide (TPR) repeat protein